MNDDLSPRLYAFLSSCSTLTLATREDTGQPMAAPLFFVAGDNLNLFFTSGAKSRHSLNLAHDTRAAAAVYGESWDWGEIAGVQLEGRVRVVSQEEWEEVWALYVAKFPFVVQFKEEVVRSTFYRFEPRWARLIDNRLGFGHKEEIAWER